MKIYTDGGVKTNPGIGSYGFVVYVRNEIIKKESGFAGDYITNSVAEYIAVIKALKYTQSIIKHKRIEFYSDSQFMVRQLNGFCRVKTKTLLPFFLTAKSLKEKSIHTISFNWIPREKNEEADLTCHSKIKK